MEKRTKALKVRLCDNRLFLITSLCVIYGLALPFFIILYIDCFEDEDSALQRDVDPSLADSSSIPLNVINTTGLDGFFPLDMIGEGDVFMANGVSLVDELFELDQGVAMEASEAHLPVTSCSDIDSVYDLPFTSPPICNPAPLVSFSPHYTSPVHSPSPVSSMSSCTTLATRSHDYHVTNPLHSLEPSSLINGDLHSNGDLELICSMIQNDNKDTKSFIDLSNLPSLPHRTIPSTTGEFTPTSNMMASPTTFMNLAKPHGNHLLTDLYTKPQTLSDYSITLATSEGLGGGGWSNDFVHNTDRGSQTDQRSSSPSPTYPIPSPTSSITTDYPDSEFSKDLGSPDMPNTVIGLSKTDIIKMPFYEFKKILDSNTVSERDKEQMKAIRKRGKNKMAAKHCRQRKLDVLSGLQQEVDRLKGVKARLALKALSLQHEIEGYKNKCTGRVYANSSRIQLSTVVH